MYTGNTHPFTLATDWVTVYPCVYREHIWTITTIISNSGLSLCIQGTQCGCGFSDINQRFIPVYTGNTIAPSADTDPATVYPCVYREHERMQVLAAVMAGLSLCIQGTLGDAKKFTNLNRFIPVYTGNTLDVQLHFRDENGLSLCIQGTRQYI